MNRYAVMAAIAAAAAAVAGCVDPNYVKPADRNKNAAEVAEKNAGAPADEKPPKEETVEEKPAPIEEVEVKCKCAPGTKHTAPCACGASDCTCKVEAPEEKKPVQETTVYYVQRGDTLSKISKKFNIRMDAIRKENASLKGDKILFGQKLILPGKLDVGKAAEKPAAPKAAPAKSAAPAKNAKYEGAVKEYVVKSGDSLGKIALAGGITVRQLKELNSLSSDMIRIGQKLKVPAEKVEKQQRAAAKAPVAAAEKKPKAESAPAKAAEETPAPVAGPAAQSEEAAPAAKAEEAKEAPAEAAPAKSDAAELRTYEVREGEDLLELSIRWNLNTPGEIREANNMSPDEELKPGQTIKVPAGAKF
ncbi:MAG: LysM peptidoglycan-binding domain-containing protein [Kiritimatiellae bacterium]|nr:LysM peptidoglycan-binding domain-containing protein [Kiritimatiellia bacterium]